MSIPSGGQSSKTVARTPPGETPGLTDAPPPEPPPVVPALPGAGDVAADPVPPSPADLIAAAIDYQQRRGWAPIPVNGKKPCDPVTGRERARWPTLRLTSAEIPGEFASPTVTGVGNILGEASKNLADVDLDCAEARAAADQLLPVTRSIFGRPGAPRSHWIYVVDTPRSSTQFLDIARKNVAGDAEESERAAMLVEFRCEGSQTVFPPSLHLETGERIEWIEDGEPTPVNTAELHRGVTLVAVASLLAREWPRGKGNRHHLALAVAGFLLRAHVGVEDVERVIRFAAQWAADDDVRDRVKAVETTLKALCDGAEATGGPRIAEILSDAVLRRLTTWVPPHLFKLMLLESRRAHARARAYRTEEGPWPDDEDAPPDADATTDEDPDRTGPTPGGSAGDRAQAGWPPLQLLPDGALPPVHTLPPTLLPAALRSWLVDAAERLSVPLELVAIPALVMLGGLIGRRIGLCPKRFADWVVVPNVWGATITRPGFLKSPAMHEAKRHMDRLAATAAAAHETRAATVEVERTIIETEIKKLKNDATRRGGDPEAIRTKLAELQQHLAAAVAIPTRFYTNDSTVEKLGVLLNENPGGLLLVRDELAGWLRTLEKPGREGDREFFLEAWNGVGRYCVDRIGRGSIDIPALTIAICGTMQPGKLQAYVAEALDSDGRGADGLLQRFQLLVWPDFSGEWYNVDRPPDLAARQRAWRVFEAVATLSAGRLPGSTDIPTIRFAPDAQELFGAWRGELEARLRSDEEFTDCPAYESHVAKYRSLMPALALIHHVADTVDAAAEGSVSFVSASVGLAAAQTAAASVDFFDEHARRVYATELDKLRAPHALLAAKIRIGAVRDGDPIRDIGRHGWTCLKTAEAVEHACATLAPLGWVRIEEFHRATQGGRPSRVLRLHPALCGAGA
jgi:hypothetical protein